MSVLDGPSLAGRREWIGLGVLALPCLLYSMDLTVLNLAVPHLSADLEPSSTQLLWIVDIYGFLVAGSLITMGTLGDRIGRRRLLLTGAVAFGAASMLAAFSFTAPMLIAARAILGVASATLAPSTLSLLRNMFLDPRERTVAVGVWIASFSAGGALGPLLGGLLLEHFWWGSVFLVNVPVMLLLLALGPRLLPEYRNPNPGRLDPISAALSLVAVLTVIYGIKRIAAGGAARGPCRSHGSRQRHRHRVRAPTAHAVGSSDRSFAVPVARVHRIASRQRPRFLRRVWDLSLYRSVPPARTRDEPTPGRTLDGPVRTGVYCRIDVGACAGTQDATDPRDRMRLRRSGGWVRGSDADRPIRRAVGGCVRLRHSVAGPGAGVHNGHRRDCRPRAA